MRFIAFIPARGGSKRIPRKNLQKVGGVTLVERAITCARHAPVISEVFVSTEDQEIADVALAAGASVAWRTKELAGDDVTMDAVVRDFVNFSSLLDTDAVVILEPTAPLRKSSDIALVAALLMGMPSIPAVRIVSGEGRDCHPYIYKDAGLASVIRVGSFQTCLFPFGTMLVHMPGSRAIDVDELEDLERARSLA